MQPGATSPRSQDPATCPYPEPNQSIPTPLVSKIHFNIILPSVLMSYKRPLSLRVTAFVFPKTFIIYCQLTFVFVYVFGYSVGEVKIKTVKYEIGESLVCICVKTQQDTIFFKFIALTQLYMFRAHL
jgi:hypothetical protein